MIMETLSNSKKFSDPLDYVLWWAEFNTRLNGNLKPLEYFVILNAKDELKRLREQANGK